MAHQRNQALTVKHCEGFFYWATTRTIGFQSSGFALPSRPPGSANVLPDRAPRTIAVASRHVHYRDGFTSSDQSAAKLRQNCGKIKVDSSVVYAAVLGQARGGYL